MKGRGLDEKKIITKIFQAPPSDLKKIQGPLFANPIEKHVAPGKLNFTGKFVVIFEGPLAPGPSLTRAKNFKGPFLHQAP